MERWRRTIDGACHGLGVPFVAMGGALVACLVGEIGLGVLTLVSDTRGDLPTEATVLPVVAVVGALVAVVTVACALRRSVARSLAVLVLTAAALARVLGVRWGIHEVEVALATPMTVAPLLGALLLRRPPDEVRSWAPRRDQRVVARPAGEQAHPAGRAPRGPLLLRASPLRAAERCPYCLDGLETTSVVRCGRCRTTLHEDCARTHRGCTTAGCERAPRPVARLAG